MRSEVHNKTFDFPLLLKQNLSLNLINLETKFSQITESQKPTNKRCKNF